MQWHKVPLDKDRQHKKHVYLTMNLSMNEDKSNYTRELINEVETDFVN